MLTGAANLGQFHSESDGKLWSLIMLSVYCNLSQSNSSDLRLFDLAQHHEAIMKHIQNIGINLKYLKLFLLSSSGILAQSE